LIESDLVLAPPPCSGGKSKKGAGVSEGQGGVTRKIFVGYMSDMQFLRQTTIQSLNINPICPMSMSFNRNFVWGDLWLPFAAPVESILFQVGLVVWPAFILGI